MAATDDDRIRPPRTFAFRDGRNSHHELVISFGAKDTALDLTTEELGGLFGACASRLAAKDAAPILPRPRVEREQIVVEILVVIAARVAAIAGKVAA